ncbi:ankyrin repeat domain-containing protein 49 isoform X2 [Enhydra lutris kenyoni]|uniref:Ankyrin repeat domain-containing protein 49 isoform X2 n=1 Tax=Enhydra lutris kenyoni TaxID=391180 RepID=A0A2Y9KE06_ENHLU|nr:ankyrin repeat domain-containing protein 49 isoform X2 [Enhydra lutris kenyoni]
MEKGKVNSDEKPDPENSLDFSEHFNQLELLETHGHLIPTGTQSLWVGNSDEDEEQDEKTEEWYQLQEKKMEKDPSKLLLWAAEKNRLTTVRRLLSEKATHVNTRDEDEYTPLHRAAYSGHLDVHDADINAQTKGLLTPLHLAAGNRDSKDTLELLLMNRYIKPGLKNNLEETAFDIARRTSVYHYLFEIVEGCTNSSPQP